MDHPYAWYVYGSYGFAALITAALCLWTWVDGQARKRELAALEQAGVKRRSAAGDIKA